MLPRALLAKAPLFFLATTLSASNPILVQVAPHVGQAPQDVRVQLRVWPDDRNRSLSVALEAADGSLPHSSYFELHGSAEPIQWTFWYKGVDPGEYTLRACVDRTDKLVCAPGESITIN